MEPNPQNALALPPHPSAEQYRKRAKALVRAAKNGPDAVTAWTEQWLDALARARQDRGASPHGSDAHLSRSVHRVAMYALSRLSAERAALHDAQLVIARTHGFASWPKLLHHIESLDESHSRSARFEQAADAITNGQLETLIALLERDPTLVETQSDREHGATLLHYVAANGVENFRQRTPPNIVRIAEYLLDAGADVNATCDVYGGGADTLGLVVTSAHPRAVGVQLPLADLLLARGAVLRRNLVRDCLHNGCPEAAAHLALRCLERGVTLSVLELAGAGQAELLRAMLAQRAHDQSELGEALGMAAWYNQADSVTCMLDSGVPVDTVNANGATALHIAAYCGHLALVESLIARGANVTRRDTQYRATPRDWANDALNKRAWQMGGPGSEATFRAIIDHLQQAESLTPP